MSAKIGITGIGCRLPGGICSPQEFWEFLCNRGDGIIDVPADRWDVDALYSPEIAAPGKTYVRKGGFLDQIDRFDPAFFRISPREAECIDPQQRLLLEVAYEALEDAGERLDDPALRRTGVFVGLFLHDYQHMQLAERAKLGPHTGTGTAMSIAANRVSYVFDLRGPSVAMDTACSSSLVAIDAAVNALLRGDCDYALAGGVNCILGPDNTIAMSKATMLSKDGYCKSFDARANGYVRSEGAGLVLLKRMPDALARGNRIYAKILGTGVNSDGRTKGISVPSGEAQEALTRSVLRATGVPAHTIDYVEAHGTGTPVGDPIEVGALGRVLSEGRAPGNTCLLGSVKSNIGHLEPASGVAGIIKVALCLHHGAIPPNLHFKTPNPAIDFDALRLEVVTENRPWPETDTPRRACLNSFGFGGTNAHAVLEEFVTPSQEAAAPAPLPAQLVLPLSAHESAALPALAAGYAQRLRDGLALDALLYTVSQRRTPLEARAALVARNREQLLERLDALAAGTMAGPGLYRGHVKETFSGRPVFVYSGMGPQWWAMGRELLDRDPIFREVVQEIDEAFVPLSSWSIRELLLSDESTSMIQQTDHSQPGIFAVQAGLTAIWKHRGIVPAATIGHSVGEIAALHAASILSLEDAVTVAYHRSLQQHRTAGSGGMLAATLAPERAETLVAELKGRVELAAINSPTAVSFAGELDALRALETRLTAEGTFAKILRVEVPYHSAKMDPIEADLRNALAGLRPQPGSCPYYSTVEGKISSARVGDADYWWRNVRGAVRFAEAVQATIADGHSCFLEVGPHPVLKTYIEDILKTSGTEGTVVSSLRRGQSDYEMLAEGLSQLFVVGAPVKWETLYAPTKLASLPLYPWQRQRYWAESDDVAQVRKGLGQSAALGATGKRHPLLGIRLDMATPTWRNTLLLEEQRYLEDHKIQGNVVYPGTGYLEMVLQTLAQVDGAGAALDAGKEYLLIKNVEVDRALYLNPKTPVQVQTVVDGERFRVESSTGSDDGWVRHAKGYCRREKTGTAAQHEGKLQGALERCPKPLASDYAYRLFQDVGLEYGPAFQCIRELRYGAGESVARLSVPEILGSEEQRKDYLFHPAVLDACLHTLFGALNLNGEDSHRRGNVFLPVSIDELRIHRRQPQALWSHARISSRKPKHFDTDLTVFDDEGRVVAEIFGLRCQAIEQPAVVAQKRRDEWLFEYRWVGSDTVKPESLAGTRWLVVAPHGDHAIVDALRAASAQPTVIVPSSSAHGSAEFVVGVSSTEDYARVLEQLTKKGGAPFAGVIHALCLDRNADADPSAFLHQEHGACSLMCLVQALTGGAGATLFESAPLWILGEGVHALGQTGVERLEHSTVWGLRRTIANEHPQLDSRIVDLDRERASLDTLLADLATPPADDELAYRAGKRFAHRLERYAADASAGVSTSSGEAKARRMEAEVPKVGDVRSLRWVELPELELGDSEVEVEIHASALNFKDLMKANGLLPPRVLEGNLWSHETLGTECSGVVARVGRAVKNVKPGDAVMGLAARSFASHAVTHCESLIPNPGLDPIDAASMPTAFLTAVVSLEHLAQLQPGERVLIHAATGGVGQAAIQVARDIGAEIYATASSPEKHRLLHELGVKHVFDSRSLRFGADVRAATGGEGVDVVLNSLGGAAIAEGFATLRDYGRFVEIGKLDLDRDFQLGLKPFSRCLSLHALDLDRLMAQKVELCGVYLRRIHERIVQGRYRPLPVTRYAAAQMADALQFMASAKHTGKLVVDIAKSQLAVQPRQELTFRKDGSYVISGGLGGFGFELAKWLASKGAGRLVLLGRRGLETPGAATACAELSALGAEVQVERCDVGRRDDVLRALAAVPVAQPVRGVFHAAAILDDALIKNMNVERYRSTFGPKAQGAWHLHCATLDAPVEHFMTFSSAATMLGNQGSGNYVAANAFVDALAHFRRTQGLPALSVNWGVIADVGMAADEDFYRQNLERNGLLTIHSSHCLELLDLLLRTGRTQTMVCRVEFDDWLRFNTAGQHGRFRQFAAGASRGARNRAAEELRMRAVLDAASSVEREAIATSAVIDILAEIFRVERTRLDIDRSLTAQGADSLMGIEIKNRLEALGLGRSVTQLMNGESARSLTTALLQSLGYTEGDQASAESGIVPITSAADRSWLVTRTPREDARLRLFCFPYAGGGTSVYARWPELLPEWIEVVAISLPGRGVRADEPNAPSIVAAADSILPELLPLLDRPFALFGHCMGAILMYEVAQRLQSSASKRPEHIFASGCMAPHLYNSPIVHEQDDERFLDVLRLISFSGTKALLEDPGLRPLTYPLLRGDFKSVVEYGTMFRERAPLLTPITGLAADNDLFAAPKAMEAWSGYSEQPYQLAELHGDHYFVESDRERVTQIVASVLASHMNATESVPAPSGITWRQPPSKRFGLPPRAAKKNPRLRAPVTQVGGTVFCFPPAGVLASEVPLPRAKDGVGRYVPVEYRGNQQEAIATRIDHMVDLAYVALADSVTPSCVFYGQCLGAAVAYELVLRLEREGRATPGHLIVAGAVGPHLYVAPNAHRLPTEKVLELLSVIEHPHVAELRSNEEFRTRRMPSLRGDLEAMATYQYESQEPLTTPITAISQRLDLWSYPLRTESWMLHTAAACQVIEWPGSHYASFHQPERVHELVRGLAHSKAAERLGSVSSAAE